MTAYTADRAETVIEEIATTIRQFASDPKGLEVVYLQLLRPEPSSKRLLIAYHAEPELLAQPKAGT